MFLPIPSHLDPSIKYHILYDGSDAFIGPNSFHYALRKDQKEEVVARLGIITGESSIYTLLDLAKAVHLFKDTSLHLIFKGDTEEIALKSPKGVAFLETLSKINLTLPSNK